MDARASLGAADLGANPAAAAADQGSGDRLALGRCDPRMMRYTRALDPHKTRAPAPVRFRRGGFVAALVLLLAACGGHRESAQPGGNEALPPLATRLFSVAYDQISERYVQQVALSNLTDAGLTNLSKLDAKF